MTKKPSVINDAEVDAINRLFLVYDRGPYIPASAWARALAWFARRVGCADVLKVLL